MMHYQLFAAGRPVKVYQDPCRPYDIKTYSGEIYKHIADEMAFSIITGVGAMEFTVVPDAPFENVKIRPLSAGITPTVKDGKITFVADKPCTLSIELDGDVLSPLFVFYTPKTPVPEKCDYYFGPGEHDVGMLTLTDGQTVYIDEDAVVYGGITAEHADNISILGEGVISGVKMHRNPISQKPLRLIGLLNCNHSKIGAVTLYDGPGYHCVLQDCEYVEVDGLRAISLNPSGDGVDVCNCRHILVHNCFFRVNDDCITLKALANDSTEYPLPIYYFNTDKNAGPTKSIYDIVSEKCVCWSATHGNGVTVGVETCTDEIYDIYFRDLDIIHCEREGYQAGGTMTISNGDRADLHHVYFENIRIEDSREKIIDMKINKTVWSNENTRGIVHDIFFKDIAIVDGPFPPSIIRGFESKTSEFAIKHDDDGTLWVVRDLHGQGAMRDITIENFTVYGEKMTNSFDAKLVYEIARNVVFK